MEKKNIMGTLISMITRPFANKEHDNTVFANQLPTEVKLFVMNNFPNASIAFAMKKGEKYELSLNDGTKVTVLSNGTLDKVERPFEPIPQSLIPESIISHTKDLFCNEQIVKLFKTFNGYYVQLTNANSFRFDMNGNFA